jgi:hypothetical protein
MMNISGSDVQNLHHYCYRFDEILFHKKNEGEAIEN